MSDALETFLKSVKKAVIELFPEFSGKIHYPIKARIIKVGSNVVDVQPLQRDGSTDEQMPPIPSLPLSTTGVQVGGLVRLGFYYYDPSQPYIDEYIG